MREFVFIKLGKKFSRVHLSEIIYTEAVKKYVKIVTQKKSYLILGSMSSVEKVLPEDKFCRIHRSYIISLNHITEFDNEVVYIGDKIFPMGIQYRENFYDRIIILSGDAKADIEAKVIL